MEFQTDFEKGFSSIKGNNNTFLFPIFKEAIITDTGEIKKLFDIIKIKFQYFNNKLELRDKEVVDILIAIMLDTKQQIFKSISESISPFGKKEYIKSIDLSNKLRDLKEKLMKKNESIITKKRQKLDKKKVQLNKIIYTKDAIDKTKPTDHPTNKDKISRFTRNMITYIDDTDKYNLVKKATGQLAYEGYQIFNHLKDLNVCYNHKTKIKVNETDGYISVPFFILYDSYEDSTNSEGRFLSSLTESDYITTYIRMPCIKQYKEVNNMINALHGNSSDFKLLIGDLGDKIQEITDILIPNFILRISMTDYSVHDTVIKKLYKLLRIVNNIVNFSDKARQKHIILSISAFKKIFLEIYQIINDNKENVITNNLDFDRILNKNGNIYTNSLLKIIYKLDFTSDINDLAALKKQLCKKLVGKKLPPSTEFTEIIRSKSISDKIFDDIISHHTVKYYRKKGARGIYMIHKGVEVDVSQKYREQDTLEKCSNLGINPIYCDHIISDLTTGELSSKIKQLLINPDYLVSSYINVETLLPDLALEYLKFWGFKIIKLDNSELNIIEPIYMWDERSITEQFTPENKEFIKENIWYHFSEIIKLVNSNPGILNDEYYKQVKYDEILEKQQNINLRLKLLDIVEDVKSTIDTSGLFKNINIYLTDNINKKLKELGFATILKNLEREFQNQIKTCLENNSTTLIPVSINYIGMPNGHTNMLSIHNNFVELVEPHGINIAISKRYNQIYNYLATFIDKRKIKRIDTTFIKSGLATSNLSPQSYEPLCTAHSYFYALLRVLYPSLPFHEIYTMTFSKFPTNIDNFISSRDKEKVGISTLDLPSEENFYDRQYVMFDNLEQDRIIRRLHNFILFNKDVNDSINSGKGLPFVDT
jgi:hypothetical protein